MAVRTFPLLKVVDDTGAVATGISSANVTIASVNDKHGVPIPSHGAVLCFDGSNVSADYDAAGREAWITLAITKDGITGINAEPSVYMAEDSSIIKDNLAYPVQPGGLELLIGTVLDVSPRTGTDFTISGMPAHAVSGSYNNAPVAAQGSMGNAVRWVQTHTRIGLTDRLQFASGQGFPAAPAVGAVLKVF